MDFICIMRLLLYLALSCGLVQVTKSSITSGFTASLIHGSSSLSESKTDRIDASLYSRQLFVYGESAQRKLKDAHVLLIGSTLLVHEIGKNLALAGVGNLYVQSAALHTSPRLSIIAESQSLSHYLKTLNPNIQVHELTADNAQSLPLLFAKHNISVTVATGLDSASLKRLDSSCQTHNVKLVACSTFGLCGYIFNDFLRAFVVADNTGEATKEVPLQGLVENTSEPHRSDQQSTVVLHTIEEESHNCGIGDIVMITAPTALYPGAHQDMLNWSGTVVKVLDTHRMEVSLAADPSGSLSALQSVVASGRATIKKMQCSVTVDHQSLFVQALRPSFCAANECAVPKHDAATSYTLWACIKVHDYLKTQSNVAHVDLPYCRTMVQAELAMLGYRDATTQGSKAHAALAALRDDIVKNFFSPTMLRSLQNATKHSEHSEQSVEECPATVSVLGSIAAQEAIKAVTHMYTPVSQLLVFESFGTLLEEEQVRHTDTATAVSIRSKHRHKGSKRSTKRPKLGSKLLRKPSSTGSLKRQRTLTADKATSPLSQLYGADVVRELQSMRIFVVGAGAIGCELLKNFALLGVGSGVAGDVRPNGSSLKEVQPLIDKKTAGRAQRQSLWSTAGLLGGGVIVTDMDVIERSNLNRQLLFREKHIGMYKSQVAAEQVQAINPALKGRVLGVTHKLGAETENTFSAAFWQDTDLVVTALDNVDARRYVDEQCVKYGRWMLDSGTQGTKGNTQVVIPFLTESYSSSADPAEEAIPLCTLKTFPYQPEHCVAWAKNKFEEYFNSDIQLLAQLRSLPSATEGTNEALIRWLETLSPEQTDRVREMKRYVPCGPRETLQWARDTFNTLYHEDMQALIREHPLDSTDEDGASFWGGSRRAPSPVQYDHMVPEHRAYVQQLAALRMRALGVTARFSGAADVAPSCEIENLMLAGDYSMKNDYCAGNSSATTTAELAELLVALLQVQMTVQPQEFEKDDATLGHVAVVAALANLRCRVYGIPELDMLAVQKMAGNIIPALATTTSLVAGLVTHEVIKVASERARHRRLCAHSAHRRPTQRLSATPGQTDAGPVDIGRVHSPSLLNAAVRLIKRVWKVGRAWWSADPVPKRTKRSNFPSRARKPTSDRSSERDMSRAYLMLHKERILQRFRNSFVNLARPMLAFAQPIEPSNFVIHGQTQTLWDTAEVPGDVTTTTLGDLKDLLQSRYGVIMQTLAWGDMLLYASFLEDTEDSVSVQRLLARAIKRSLHSDGSQKVSTKDVSTQLRERLKGQEFILLDITAEQEGEDGEATSEVKIPPLKVFFQN